MLKNAKFEDDFLFINDFLLNPSEEFTFLVFTKESPSKIIYHSRIANINELVLENEAKPIRILINKEKSDAFLRFMKLRLEKILGRKISPNAYACYSTQEEYEQGMGMIW